jgi:hypothetical protein
MAVAMGLADVADPDHRLMSEHRRGNCDSLSVATVELVPATLIRVAVVATERMNLRMACLRVRADLASMASVSRSPTHHARRLRLRL